MKQVVLAAALVGFGCAINIGGGFVSGVSSRNSGSLIQSKDNLRVSLTQLQRTEAEEHVFFRKLEHHHQQLVEGTYRSHTERRKRHQHKHRANWKIHLEDINNSQFVGEIRVGSPGQTFAVIFDTGSSNLWINGIHCTDQACLKHRRFDPSQSRTFTLLDMDMDVMFGTGQISGSLATDSFELGGSLLVHNQTFGMINVETGEVFNAGSFDGILGLSFPALSASSYTPVFDNIMNQHLLPRNMFSFYYSKLPVQESVIEFGIPSREYYHGDLEFVEVSQPVYWELTLKDILIDGKPQNVCKHKQCKVVVDTGTSLLTGPTDGIFALVRAIDMNGDCNQIQNLPTMTYVIEDKNGEHHFDLESSFYVVQSDTSEDDGVTPRYCKPGFMALDVPEPRGPLWILGDLFMQKYFTVFSREPAQVGFAVAAHRNA
mmetsp:Transcript_38061/g.74847  ORF Transcript_38061/g.74847 Transcript_38061/m.74847 type:complete len:430 (+) Transcript_38061:29-1318(+)|eukprot:CAMPEP_0175142258 /NCGR_PEP_ID=MMETSP0087-20121206/12684_1 /TAXON_ID=136419 /ORGANISM="Unknown Unknown, Strain D1" /LENGTH=429 /DNA_ID=CAMNT_0016426011 /DNA_START=27 /DNA_END=1316 /DNA_ORIENTATION=-